MNPGAGDDYYRWFDYWNVTPAPKVVKRRNSVVVTAITNSQRESLLAERMKSLRIKEEPKDQPVRVKKVAKVEAIRVKKKTIDAPDVRPMDNEHARRIDVKQMLPRYGLVSRNGTARAAQGTAMNATNDVQRMLKNTAAKDNDQENKNVRKVVFDLTADNGCERKTAAKKVDTNHRTRKRNVSPDKFDPFKGNLRPDDNILGRVRDILSGKVPTAANGYGVGLNAFHYAMRDQQGARAANNNFDPVMLAGRGIAAAFGQPFGQYIGAYAAPVPPAPKRAANYADYDYGLGFGNNLYDGHPLYPGHDIGMNAMLHEDRPVIVPKAPKKTKKAARTDGANVNGADQALPELVPQNVPSNLKLIPQKVSTLIPQKVVVKEEPKSPERANKRSMTLYKQLEALSERGGCITNAEEFDCIICMTTTEVGDGVLLRLCLHQFCSDCIRSTIILSEEAEIACPYGDGTNKCEGVILDLEIRAMLSPEEYDKYLIRSLRIAEGTMANTVHCKKVNCDGWCICDEGINQFMCPKCESPNCISCQVNEFILQSY